MDQNAQPGISLAQVLLEAVVFAHREDALALPPNTVLEVELQMDGQLALSPGEQAGVLRLTIRSNDAKNPIYRLSLTVAAVIHRTPGQENMTVQEYATNSAVPLLYPFMREAVANITGRGRFGPLWLHPVNFQAMATQHGAILVPAAPGQAEVSGTASTR